MPVRHNFERGDWTEDEHKRLVTGIKFFGADYEKIAELIGTKDRN